VTTFNIGLHDIPNLIELFTRGARAMNDINRRTVFVAGLAATSLISNTCFGAAADEVSPEARLRELGIDLPKVPAPVANYVPSARLGNIIFLAVQGHSIPMALGRRAR
jgi:hypothetical protein